MKVSEAILVFAMAGLASPAEALAQCSTADLDGNGVPDVCPAGSNYIAGTAGDDVLTGSNQADCIFGFGGNDTINGRNGGDYICAGDGNDTVLDGNGDDTNFGEGGDDFIDGGGGNDFIDGGAGNDVLNGGNQNDTINGGDGNDTINGGNGNDVLSGQAGDDTINGDNGNDSLSGGPGTDTLDGGGGTNTCVEEVPGTSTRLTNCNNVTYAAVDRFDVSRSDPGVAVAWETTTEVGVVAFRLWRVEDNGVLSWVGEIAAAPEGAPLGARYFLRDGSAPSNDLLEYVLEERTVSGGSVRYGPFVRSPTSEDTHSASFQSSASQGRVPHPVALQRLSLPVAGRQLPSFRRKGAAPPTAVELAVDQSGVIEVSAETLAASLETSLDAAANLIRSGGLQLRLRGESVAWHAVDDGAALRFVAPEIRSAFSSQHRYLLSVEDGVTMETRTLVPGVATEAHTFLDTKRFEENVFAGPAGDPDPRQDLFFWYALSSNEQATIPISLPAMAGPAAEELRVFVHAATEHPDQPHRVELLWNGQSLGLFDLFGRRRHTITVPLDGVSAAPQNELVVRQYVAGEAPPVIFIDAAEVDYIRFADADGLVFRFGGAEDGACSLTGIASETAYLYDVTEPARPKTYGEVVLDEAGRLSFTAAGADLRFLIAAPASVSTPVAVVPHFPSSLRSPDHSVDYLIISASHLLADAQALADLREADGYRVLSVDVDDVYWEFAGGEPDPLAIRDFLAFARQHWASGPKFVALIGKGSLDYRDLMGLGGNWLPPVLAPTDGGLVPSDSMFGDVEGDDGVPEIAVGRLPISTPDQLSRIVTAIRAFEKSHGSMDALFAADDSEHDEFIAAARALEQWMAAERTQEVDLNAESLESARGRMFSMWGSSLSWLSYVGHGGLDRLATEGLLTSADLPTLVEMQSTPVVLGWSCNIARFDIPGFFSLGEQLVTEGTSAGVFSATGWSNHVETDAFRTAFTEAAFASDAETIGEAMIRAHQAASGASVAIHRVYMLLGDPALRLRVAKATPTPDPEIDPLPTGGPTEPSGPTRAGDQSAELGSGCAIAAGGSGSGPFGLELLLVGCVLAIRRCRTYRG